MQLIFFTLVLIGLGFVACDPPVTKLDRAAIKKFRPMVVDFLPHEYMKKDSYLLRWIRTKKYDLEGAEELLRKNIEWRKENNMDSLKYNKNGPFHKDFPLDAEGVDKEGRPVVLTDFTGDIRKAVVAGKRKELFRHLANGFELAEQKMRALNVHNNNSEWIGVYDFNKFTPQTHLCIQCLRVYADMAITEESNYPLGPKELIVINAPRAFDAVLKLVAPILGDTFKKVITFGSDKREWRSYLLDRIPADQLTPQFGGTRKARKL